MEAGQTKLQQDLQMRIVKLIHEQSLQPGARIVEFRLAQDLGVSRTPVRAALSGLAAAGFLRKTPNKGIELVALPPLFDSAASDSGSEEQLVIQIARDRGRGALAEDVSEAELMQNYGLSRQSVRTALSKLAELHIIERKAGYGWRFVATFRDSEARAESYRFRIVIETAAILEPGFRLDHEWVQTMRALHGEAMKQALSGEWQETSSISFFEMNAAFHAGLGEASGNRYFAQAINNQNQFRRLSNYDWKHGADRVVINCRQHLEILDKLEDGDRELAAMLMKRHLEIASQLQNSISKSY